MRWIRYSRGGAPRYGLLEGETVVEVAGSPFGQWERAGGRHALSEVRIEVPVVPGTFYCAGKNYIGHIEAVSAAGVYDANVPQVPYVAYRAVNALLPHGGSVVVPQGSTDLQYEGELVAVIGSTARNVSEHDALAHVLGYTIYNDVSERAWQRSDTTNWRAKNSDTFSPLGPWIETDPDLEAMETVVRLNGREQDRFRTGRMIFGVAAFIAAITRHVTLHPGDVIAMGADGGSPSLKPGDVVEVEITGIGTLRNAFVAERAV